MILARKLLTLHNVHFYLDLVAQARAHIESGDFAPWHRAWIERYEAGGKVRIPECGMRIEARPALRSTAHRMLAIPQPTICNPQP